MTIHFNFLRAIKSRNKVNFLLCGYMCFWASKDSWYNITDGGTAVSFSSWQRVKSLWLLRSPPKSCTIIIFVVCYFVIVVCRGIWESQLCSLTIPLTRKKKKKTRADLCRFHFYFNFYHVSLHRNTEFLKSSMGHLLFCRTFIWAAPWSELDWDTVCLC